MKTLLDPARREEVKSRLSRIGPDSPRVWGKMTAAQAIAHCSIGLEMATGDAKLPRVMIGRVLGPMVRGLALRDDAPMKKNSPTAPSMVIRNERNLETERQRLMNLIDKFGAGGAAGCTDHPHPFFGRLDPEQWGVLMYKHLDHHLRQFSA